jgi:hypothetical protein
VQPVFAIVLHQNDRAVLEMITSYLRVGKISNSGLQTIQYRVTSLKDLEVLTDHFDLYPLITKKHADYLLLKKVIHIIKAKKHLTTEGLAKILAIKSSMNKGLS